MGVMQNSINHKYKNSFEIPEGEITASEYLKAYEKGKRTIIYFQRGSGWVVKNLYSSSGEFFETKASALLMIRSLVEKDNNLNVIEIDF